MFSSEITQKSHQLIKLLRSREMKMAAAESCTGGMLGAVITEIPGASDVFERGYITYSNESKIELLTVPTFFIEDYGAVSKQTAIAMAEGALLMSRADISVSITGLAGPEGGTDEKPVGTVFIACAYKDYETICEQHLFNGARHAIREQSVIAALDIISMRVEN